MRSNPVIKTIQTVDADGDVFVSVKTLAVQWDCSKSTVSRLLAAAGVVAYYFGRGRNGSKRYRKTDIDRYLRQLERSSL